MSTVQLPSKIKTLYSTLFETDKSFYTFLNKKRKDVLLLIGIGCLWHTLSITLNFEDSTHIWSSFLVSFSITLCCAWIFFYGYAFIICFFAKILSGKGNVKSTYEALLWSFTPWVIMIVTYILAVSFFGANVIKRSTAIDNLYSIRMIIIAINAITTLWVTYRVIKGVMIVHSLSFIRAMLALILPMSIVWLAFYL
ncbi:Yip1 domain protein [compost metagenome]